MSDAVAQPAANNTAVVVRPAVEADAPAIAAMQIAMAKETEGLELDPATVERGVRTPFHRPQLGRYYVATIDGNVVGCLLITFEWSDWRAGTIFWIQSVFTLSEFRRCGVFSALYAHVHEAAAADPECCGMRLYVENENTRAQATYERLGMKAEHYTMMKWMKGSF